jgi:hypothetical protein
MPQLHPQIPNNIAAAFIMMISASFDSAGRKPFS